MKQSIKATVRSATKTVKRHAPTILLCAGVGGFAMTAVSAFKSAPKVNLVLEDAEIAKKEELTRFEKVEIIFKTMWPTFTLAALSAVCLFISKHMTDKRVAATTFALAASERKLKGLQDEVLESFGEQALKDAKKNFCKKQVEKNPPKDKVYVVDGSDDVLCFDSTSGRYFYSTKNKIEAAFNRINDRLMQDEYITLNELYYELDNEGKYLPNIEVGDNLGWEYRFNGLADAEISAEVNEKGQPFLVLSYEVYPHWYKST